MREMRGVEREEEEKEARNERRGEGKTEKDASNARRGERKLGDARNERSVEKNGGERCKE